MKIVQHFRESLKRNKLFQALYCYQILDKAGAIDRSLISDSLLLFVKFRNREMVQSLFHRNTNGINLNYYVEYCILEKEYSRGMDALKYFQSGDTRLFLMIIQLMIGTRQPLEYVWNMYMFLYSGKKFNAGENELLERCMRGSQRLDIRKVGEVAVRHFYYKLAHHLCYNRALDEFMQVLEHMKALGHDYRQFKPLLIRIYAQRGDLFNAIKYWKLALDENLPVNLGLYSALLACACKKNRKCVVMSIYQSVVRTGKKPTRFMEYLVACQLSKHHNPNNFRIHMKNVTKRGTLHLKSYEVWIKFGLKTKEWSDIVLAWEAVKSRYTPSSETLANSAFDLRRAKEMYIAACLYFGKVDLAAQEYKSAPECDMTRITECTKEYQADAQALAQFEREVSHK